MKNIITILLLLTTHLFAADVKISALPLLTASSVGSTDSFPFVNVGSNETARLKISDILNVPSLTTQVNTIITDNLNASSVVITDGSNTLKSLGYGSANTASTIVKRDGSGNFSAGTITASLTGLASLNLAIASNLSDVNNAATSFNNISGMSVIGDLIYGGALGVRAVLAGPTAANSYVLTQTGTGSGGAAPIWVQYTNANTASTLVKRDSSGNFSAGTISAALTGTASGNLSYTANNHGVLFSGSANTVTVLAPDSSTAKSLISGGASADPSWSLLTNSNLSGSAAITNANLATMASSSSTVGTVKGNISGSSAVPSDIVLSSANTASSAVYRDASGNFSTGTITGSLTGSASGNLSYSANNHGVLFSGSANTVTVLTPDSSATKVLKSGGASADPSWLAYDNANTVSTLVFRDGSGNFSAGTVSADLTGIASGNTTYTANQYGVVLSGAGNAMSVLAPDSSTTKILVSGGASANPAWGTVTSVLPAYSGDSTSSAGGTVLTAAATQSNITTLSATGGITISKALTAGGSALSGTHTFTNSAASATTPDIDLPNGRTAIQLGADNGATTRTDATNKETRISMYPYTIANTPYTVLYPVATSGVNTINIGGGTGQLNAATEIDFYTAANANTTSGTKRLGIDSSGVATFSGNAVSPAFVSSTANPATTGPIRLANNEYMWARDHTNATNFRLIGSDATDDTSVAGGALILENGSGRADFVDQISAPALTNSSAAKTGTLCWTSGTGLFTVDTTVACLSSTMRVKEAVKPLDVGLNEVMQLKPVSYHLKKEFNPMHLGRMVGLIAEEVAKVDDRLVAYEDDGQAVGVRYMQMTAILVKAIQEQQAEIEDLKKELGH